MAVSREDITLLQSVYDSHPIRQVAEVAGIALSVVEISKAVKKQKDAFFVIGRGTRKIAVEFINRIRVEYSIQTDIFKTEVLRANLRLIRDYIRNHVRSQTLVGRVLLYGYSDVKTIHKCWICLRECFGILGLQFGPDMWDHVLALGCQLEELREHQRQALSTETPNSHNMSHDSAVGESFPAGVAPGSTGDTVPSHREGPDSPSNCRAIGESGTTTFKHPVEGASSIRTSPMGSGKSVSYTRVLGNMVTSSVESGIRIGGVGNTTIISC